MSSIFADELDCPRCGGGVPNDAERGAYPGALSRWTRDGTREPIEVCSACGTEEAMLEFFAKDPELAIHPVHGERPWVTVPTGI